MNQEEVTRAHERNEFITILTRSCRWDWQKRCLAVKGKDWKGYILPEEMGVKFQYNAGYIPNNIAAFLKENSCFDVFVIKKDGEEFVFSRKAYVETCKEKIEVGKIYYAEICSLCKFGVFCKINGAIVLVHAKELTACWIGDMRKANAFEIGTKFPVKIMSKEVNEDGLIYISASRKAASVDKKYFKDDVVKVIIGGKVSTGNGFYCEVTPNQAGIIDIPPEYMDCIEEGSYILGIVKAVTDKGYRVRSLLYYIKQ